MRLLLFALLCVPAIAGASSLPDYPFVYVYGIADKEVAPDRAVLEFDLKVYDQQADRAYQRQTESVNAILAHADKLGLVAKDIVAQAIEKMAVRREDDQGKEYEIIGYELRRHVRIVVNDLQLFPALIEFLHVQANVESVSASFSRHDEESVLQELITDACRVAQENAARLAKGFSRELGSVRAVSETGFSGVGSAFGFPGDVGYGSASAMSKRDFRVIPATISYRRGVFAIFALKE